MKDPKHARLMLEMATADLQAIRNMSDPNQFADSVFGFHCQQAVEKLLKAWLSLGGVAVPRTHDLRFLLQLVDDLAPGETSEFQDLDDLTDYGVQFRYEAPMALESLDRVILTKRVGGLFLRISRLLEVPDGGRWD